MLVSIAASAEDPALKPLEAIEQYGSISISDGSSWYTFNKDGSFRSGPFSISGRTFNGRWEQEGQKFTVTAQLGWANGFVIENEYRRIKFVIYYVTKIPPEKGPVLGERPKDMFSSYFIIDELVKIPAPGDPKEK